MDLPGPEPRQPVRRELCLGARPAAAAVVVVAATREEYRFLISMLAYTGLRSSEACGLRVGRVDVMRGRIEVIETLMRVDGEFVVGSTKTYANRTVPMPKFLQEEAAAHLGWLSEQLGWLSEQLGWLSEQLGRPLGSGDLVFPPIGMSGQGGTRSEYLVSESVRGGILKPALTRAGLPSTVRVHDLRHTAASLLIQLGAHPRAIMERLGHADITVTLGTYGHLFPQLEAELTERLDELQREAMSDPWTRPRAVVTELAG